MREGTTPTYEFSIGINNANIERVLITFAQKGSVVVEKNENDVSWTTETSSSGTSYIASVTLTQSETKKFCNHSIDVQMRILTNAGVAMNSDKFVVAYETALNPTTLTFRNDNVCPFSNGTEFAAQKTVESTLESVTVTGLVVGHTYRMTWIQGDYEDSNAMYFCGVEFSSIMAGKNQKKAIIATATSSTDGKSVKFYIGTVAGNTDKFTNFEIREVD